MYADDTTLSCCLEDIKSINKQDVINKGTLINMKLENIELEVGCHSLLTMTSDLK